MLERLASAIVLLLCLSLPAGGQEETGIAGEAALERVDLRLKIAAATMNHRLLVYQTCEAGSCSSESHLQWFKNEWSVEDGSDDATAVRSVLADCPLPELSGDVLVHSARWSTGAAADPHLLVVTSPPARRSESREIELTPGRPCDYVIEPRTADEE